jgi:hypothetical protein
MTLVWAMIFKNILLQAIKAKREKWDCIKIKSFCTSKRDEVTYRLQQNVCKSYIG